MTDWLDTLTDIAARSGADSVLVTTVATEGSTPRERGARMIVTAKALHGTIGGGRLEQLAVEKARALLGRVERPPGERGGMLRHIALGPSVGQCCGGAVALALEVIDASRRGTGGTSWLEALRAHRDRGDACVIVTYATTSDLQRGSAPEPTAGPASAEGPTRVTTVVVGPGDACHGADEAGAAVGGAASELLAPLVDHARTMLRRATRGNEAGPAPNVGVPVLFEYLAPPDLHVMLFGAGHVGRALVAILAGLPCRVTWIDTRDDQHPAPLPANVTALVSAAPEDDVDAAPPGSYFAVMTHSHDLDFRVSERILRRDDFVFFGLIGSRTKRAKFETRLRARGMPKETIARMTCPIGLADVPGKHPGEIAVGVAAQLLQVRAASQRRG